MEMVYVNDGKIGDPVDNSSKLFIVFLSGFQVFLSSDSAGNARISSSGFREGLTHVPCSCRGVPLFILCCWRALLAVAPEAVGFKQMFSS